MYLLPKLYAAYVMDFLESALKRTEHKGPFEHCPASYRLRLTLICIDKYKCSGDSERIYVGELALAAAVDLPLVLLGHESLRLCALLVSLSRHEWLLFPNPARDAKKEVQTIQFANHGPVWCNKLPTWSPMIGFAAPAAGRSWDRTDRQSRWRRVTAAGARDGNLKQVPAARSGRF